MNSITRLRTALVAGICAASAPWLLAQTSSSTPTTSSPSTPTTTAPSATTNTTQRNAATTTTTTPSQAQTAPGAVTTPAAPFSPAPVTQPVPNAVVPPVQTPNQGAPTNVTQPAGRTVPGTVVQPPGSTNASTMLDANGQPMVVSGASIDALAAAGVEVAVDPQNALTNLRRANASGQQGVTAELQTRVDATSRALTEARAQSRANGFPISDSDFDQLAAEIRVREDVLRQTLRNATLSNSETEWRQLQSVLDSQYSAYADSVLRAYRLLQQTPQP